MNGLDGNRPTGPARWAGIAWFVMRRGIPRNTTQLGLMLEGVVLGMLVYGLVALVFI